MTDDVADMGVNETQAQYEATVNGELVSVVGYQEKGEVLVILHTATVEGHRRRGHAGGWSTTPRRTLSVEVCASFRCAPSPASDWPAADDQRNGRMGLVSGA